MACKRTHRGELKEIEERDLAPQCILQTGLHLGNRERVRAKVKEVIVHADGRNPKRLLPDAGDGAFNFVGRLLSGFCHVSARGEHRQRHLEQCLTIDFSVIRKRQCGKKDKAGRNHVVGQLGLQRIP